MFRTLIAIVCATTLSFAAAAEGAWLTDFNQAVAEAKKSGKPLLLDFTGSDWCGWCIKLKKEVFDQPEFATWAKDHVVLVEVDFPNGKPQSAAVKQQNEELSKRFDIQGFPTIVILDPTGTKRLGDLGYQEGGAKAWIEAAEKITVTAKP